MGMQLPPCWAQDEEPMLALSFYFSFILVAGRWRILDPAWSGAGRWYLIWNKACWYKVDMLKCFQQIWTGIAYTCAAFCSMWLWWFWSEYKLHSVYHQTMAWRSCSFPSQLFAGGCWGPEWDISFLPLKSPLTLALHASCVIKNTIKSIEILLHSSWLLTETLHSLYTCHRNSKQTGKQSACLSTGFWDKSPLFPTVRIWYRWSPRRTEESKLSPWPLRKVKDAAVVSITEVMFRGRM